MGAFYENVMCFIYILICKWNQFTKISTFHLYQNPIRIFFLLFSPKIWIDTTKNSHKWRGKSISEKWCISSNKSFFDGNAKSFYWISMLNSRTTRLNTDCSISSKLFKSFHLLHFHIDFLKWSNKKCNLTDSELKVKVLLLEMWMIKSMPGIDDTLIKYPTLGNKSVQHQNTITNNRTGWAKSPSFFGAKYQLRIVSKQCLMCSNAF